MQASTYSIGDRFRTRAIAPAKGEGEEMPFWVGTLSLSEENQLQYLSFNEDTNVVQCLNTFNVEHEVWSLASSQTDERQIAAIDGQNGVYIYSHDGDNLNQVTKMNHQRANLLGWTADHLATASPSSLISWDTETHQEKDRIESQNRIYGFAEDPHHPASFALAIVDDIQVWDLRANSTSYSIPQAHNDTILDLDFNPNKPYNLVSSSRDGCIRFWDIRQPTKALKNVTEHSHWVYQIKYNQFHDQLLISSSSDNTCLLHRILSISSTPMDENMNEERKDEVIHKGEDYQDTIYAICWLETWFYAALSYDSKVFVNQVSSEVKYNIIL